MSFWSQSVVTASGERTFGSCGNSFSMLEPVFDAQTLSQVPYEQLSS
jgi:hypothetical protein